MKSALMFCRLLNSEPIKDMLKKYKITILLKRTLLYIKNTVFGGHHLIGGCSNLIDENFELKGNPGVFILMRAYSQILFRVIFMPLLFYCPNYFPISLLQDYIVTQVETGMPEYELIDRDELVSILVLFVPIGSVFFAHSFSKLRNSKHTVREFERQFTEKSAQITPSQFYQESSNYATFQNDY